MERDRYEVPPDAEFDLPWVVISAEAEARRHVKELLAEMPGLALADPHAIARRADTGDVLFWFAKANEVRVGGFPFAVVPLVGAGANESDLRSRIEYFECWSGWLEFVADSRRRRG